MDQPEGGPAPPSGFRDVWLPRVIITVGLVVVFGAFAFAFRAADTGTRGEQLDLAVESVFPTQGALEPRQTTVLVDLAPGWVVDEFWIEGVRLEDEFVNDSGAALGQFYFEPGEGTPFPLFQPGTIEVIIIVFNELDPTQRRNVAWSFTAS